MSLIPFFGDGHLLWASDDPHSDSIWPNSRAAIERQMRPVSPESPVISQSTFRTRQRFRAPGDPSGRWHTPI
jgi:hypothetical protein